MDKDFGQALWDKIPQKIARNLSSSDATALKVIFHRAWLLDGGDIYDRVIATAFKLDQLTRDNREPWAVDVVGRSGLDRSTLLQMEKDICAG